MSKKIILDICGGTGCWSKYYKKNGYDVRIITLPDYDITNKEVQKYCVSLKPYGILAAPPCTMFSIARNDKTAKEPRDLRSGMIVVDSVLNVIRECFYQKHKNKDCFLKFWAIENPNSGYLKKFIGRPYYVFEPYYFGDEYTKKTALWGYFNIPVENRVTPRDFKHSCGEKDFVSCVEHYADLKSIPDGYCEKTGYSKRKVMRSMTPLGFSKAFYKANK